MRTRHVILLTLCAAALAAFGSGHVGAQNREDTRPQERRDGPGRGAMLGTLQRGDWQCALPGDAGGEAFVVVEAEGFRIGNASSYTSPAGRGIYLLRGNELVFTRGPKKDQRFRLLGANTLQRIGADGKLSKLICTRLGGFQ